MKAIDYLNSIGIDDSDIADSIFNEDDKSFYTIEELMESYADFQTEELKKQIRQLLLDEDLEMLAKNI